MSAAPRCTTSVTPAEPGGRPASPGQGGRRHLFAVIFTRGTGPPRCYGHVEAIEEVPMSVTDEYLKNNEAYASTFSGPLPLPPSKHVAVVACMDARLDVYRLLGLGRGVAHRIRTPAGGATAG